MKTHFSFSLLILAAFLSGCDFAGGTNPGGGPVYQTEVLEVRVEPMPVVVGDTVTFTAIIRDSLDMSFRFSWDLGIPSGSPFNGTEISTGNDNHVGWVVPGKAGLYLHSVLV